MRPTRTAMKQYAQTQLMHGIGNVLGYWEEDPSTYPKGWDEWSEAQRQEYRDVIQQQADRVARTLGYEEAWRN